MIQISDPIQYEGNTKIIIENDAKYQQDEDMARTARREELRVSVKKLRDALAQPGKGFYLTAQETDYIYNLVTRLYNEVTGN